jgi:hypothetical protein
MQKWGNLCRLSEIGTQVGGYWIKHFFALTPKNNVETIFRVSVLY